MRIFTFWEPRRNLPGYIEACIATWRKYIPDADVRILDFTSLRELIGEQEFDLATSTALQRSGMAKQVDVYKSLLLAKFGGIFMDADTIITPKFGAMASDLVGDRITMFSQEHDDLSAAFIYAPRPAMDFILKWKAEALERVVIFNRYCDKMWLRILRRSKWRIYRRWNYFFNAIVDPLKKLLPDAVNVLDRNEYGTFPERDCGNDDDIWQEYNDYYFGPGDAAHALSFTHGLIMLHNSFTPSAVRAMPMEEFLAQDFRLAKILRVLIGR